MIYAISDIHGCLDAFEKRLEQINPELQKEGNRRVLIKNPVRDEEIRRSSG